MVFVTDTDDGLRDYRGQDFGEYVYTNVLGTKLGIHRFYLVKNNKFNLKDAF